MGAVGGAEGIVHIDIGDFGQFLGEHRVISLFFIVIADILEQDPGDAATFEQTEDFSHET